MDGLVVEVGKMSKELHERIDKVKNDLENIIKLPEEISIKKGRLMQNTSDTENKKLELSDDLIKAEENYQEINKELKLKPIKKIKKSTVFVDLTLLIKYDQKI